MSQIYADFWDDFRFLGFAMMSNEGAEKFPSRGGVAGEA
jgi:hypothetical protein